MATQGSERLRWIRDQLDRSTDELAATVERLPEAWRRSVGADLERLVSDARMLTRSVGRALEARLEEPTSAGSPDERDHAA